jgi:hypothetical protein
LPNEFFALLLTGRYSLVEAYAMVSRYTSWRMVLFGDPLYNPWKGKHFISELGSILQLGTSGHTKFPITPSAQTLRDPIKTRQEFKKGQKARLAQVNSFLEQRDRSNRSSR